MPAMTTPAAERSIRALMLLAYDELLGARSHIAHVRTLTDAAYRLRPDSGLRPQDDKTFAAVELARRTVDELAAAYAYWLEAQVAELRDPVDTTVEHRVSGPLADVEDRLRDLLDDDGNPPIL